MKKNCEIFKLKFHINSKNNFFFYFSVNVVVSFYESIREEANYFFVPT